MREEIKPSLPSDEVTDSTDFFKRSFLLSPIPTAIINLKAECLFVNHAYKGLFIQESEGFGTDPAHRVDSIFSRREDFDRLMSDIQEKGVIRRQEARVRDCDTNPMQMLMSGRKVEFEGVEAIELSMMDISKQIRLQHNIRREYARMESLQESMDVGLFMVGKKDKLREINQQLANLFEIQREDLVGKPYQDLFGRVISMVEEPEVLQQRLQNAITAINERPTIGFTLESELARVLELSFFPVWDEKGYLSGWGGMVQDVTEVHESVSWKLEMLSVLSHDIRAPLATLKGQTTALLANFRLWSEEMVTDFLEGINRSTDKLIHQVDRSLALTRVETGQLGLRPEACRPDDILSQSLERISGLMEEIRVELKYSSDLPEVRADPARVEEVLINLLENAFRYSPLEQSITVEVQVVDPMVEISVTDHGPGVPKDDQAKIFEKFGRADRESEGSGLGLYISRMIVEAHGGRIWVESPPEGMEQGTRFTFSLPLMPPEVKVKVVEEEVKSVITDDPIEGLQILVVEDEPDFQALLHTILTREGYQVVVAPDGPTAIDIVHTSSPDIILLDWMMPGMSGLSTCRNIRRWTDAPILMVTSRTAQEDLIAALDAGADDYVTKPFKTPEFLARIQALARRRETLVDHEPDRFTFDGLSISFDTYEVWRSGERVELTPTEFELLAYLVRNRGQVLTYDQLMEHLYGMEKDRNRHDLFVHVSRLRKKIEPNSEEPRYILTKWGVGYSFEVK
jgi:DNA-binding response OmpR family regulator/signal transduction histidine kinase